jgi:hypothetical protein
VADIYLRPGPGNPNDVFLRLPVQATTEDVHNVDADIQIEQSATQHFLNVLVQRSSDGQHSADAVTRISINNAHNVDAFLSSPFAPILHQAIHFVDSNVQIYNAYTGHFLDAFVYAGTNQQHQVDCIVTITGGRTMATLNLSTGSVLATGLNPATTRQLVRSGKATLITPGTTGWDVVQLIDVPTDTAFQAATQNAPVLAGVDDIFLTPLQYPEPVAGL